MRLSVAVDLISDNCAKTDFFFEFSTTFRMIVFRRLMINVIRQIFVIKLNFVPLPPTTVTFGAASNPALGGTAALTNMQVH